jgi:hypothetical protein
MDVARAIHDDPLFAWHEPAPRTSPAAAVQDACSAPAEIVQEPAVEEPVPAEFGRLVAAIEPCIGEAQAKTAWDVARETGLGEGMSRLNRERRVRHLVEVHFDRFPWPVCALSTGYFRPVSADEIAHYDAAITSRIMCMFRRRSTFRRACRNDGWPYLGRGHFGERGR